MFWLNTKPMLHMKVQGKEATWNPLSTDFMYSNLIEHGLNVFVLIMDWLLLSQTYICYPKEVEVNEIM